MIRTIGIRQPEYDPPDRSRNLLRVVLVQISNHSEDFISEKVISQIVQISCRQSAKFGGNLLIFSTRDPNPDRDKAQELIIVSAGVRHWKFRPNRYATFRITLLKDTQTDKTTGSHNSFVLSGTVKTDVAASRK